MNYDGFIINKGELVEYSGTASEVVIPPEVDSVGYKAFYGRDSQRVSENAPFRSIIGSPPLLGGAFNPDYSME